MHYSFKKLIVLFCLSIFFISDSFAFCGFYVAKADATIFNKASQVIIAREKNKTVITMSNDFQGRVKNFAMVVPVPMVLQQKDIRVVNRNIFDKLDAYSAPRLVEYYDQNPCSVFEEYDAAPMSVGAGRVASSPMKSLKEDINKDYGVTIKAKYNVGEYDILILDATQSSGLKRWLTDNGYKIPKNAEEVLEPYIKSKMNFFVAKVNLEQFENNGFTNLRPLQITLNSPKFMLPIRLGMANGQGDQDLIIYMLNQQGRVECTNYRTVKMPTDMEMPTFIKNDFGRFYADVFEKRWERNNGKAVYLEYAWDISPRNYVKCDPCVSQAPNYAELKEAGAWWVNGNQNEIVYFTRLHVRYNRQNFPQDLQFQATADKSNFQARYILNHTYTGDISCEDGQTYVKKVISRREGELENLEYYAGWDSYNYSTYLNDWKRKLRIIKYKKGGLDLESSNNVFLLLFLLLNVSIVLSILKWKKPH